MTPSQRIFYQELLSKTFDQPEKGEPRNPYPHLAHLKTPSERYKNLVESPNYYSKRPKGGDLFH